MNKLTLPYFNSFCQSFSISCFYNIFDQCLFCCYEKLFQRVHKKVTKIKKWLALNLPLTLLFSNVSWKLHLVIRNFFPTPTYNWLTVILVYIFRRLKRKIKCEEIDWNPVQIWCKIELIYSISKPVIWKFNFSNSLNVQLSSRNVRFDGYREKVNPLFTFNVIKLVLFWHKLYCFCYLLKMYVNFLRSQVSCLWLLSFIFL